MVEWWGSRQDEQADQAEVRNEELGAVHEGAEGQGSLAMWLNRDMAWQAAPASGKPGRPATYSDAAVQCCLTMKVLFGLALRRTQGFVQRVPGLSGLDRPTAR